MGANLLRSTCRISILWKPRSLKNVSRDTNTTLPLLLSDSLGLKRDLSIGVTIDTVFSSLDNAYRSLKDIDIAHEEYILEIKYVSCVELE